MKVVNNKIVEATENELFDVYLRKGYDEAMDFKEFARRCERAGTVVVEENDRRQHISEDEAFEQFVRGRVAVLRMGKITPKKYTFSDYCKRIESFGTIIDYVSSDISVRNKESELEIKKRLAEPEYKYINKSMKKILKTKQSCLEMIHDIAERAAVGYDGFRDAKNLTELINELKEIAIYGVQLEE